jgi:hypothetical protein
VHKRWGEPSGVDEMGDVWTYRSRQDMGMEELGVILAFQNPKQVSGMYWATPQRLTLGELPLGKERFSQPDEAFAKISGNRCYLWLVFLSPKDKWSIPKNRSTYLLGELPAVSLARKFDPASGQYRQSVSGWQKILLRGYAFGVSKAEVCLKNALLQEPYGWNSVALSD